MFDDLEGIILFVHRRLQSYRGMVMTKYALALAALATAVAALGTAMLQSRAASAAPQQRSFSEEVMPVFCGYCVSCTCRAVRVTCEAASILQATKG